MWTRPGHRPRRVDVDGLLRVPLREVGGLWRARQGGRLRRGGLPGDRRPASLSPFPAAEDTISALPASTCPAAAGISAFSSLPVARDRSYPKTLAGMAALSLGVAAASFAVGWAVGLAI